MFKWLFKKKGCAKHMNNKLEVIGIDHGWSMMKTISQVFVTGVKEITTTPALFGDVLEYEGKFYKVGTVRQEVKDTKVEDDSFYLLTLAAVAKELKRRGLAEAKVFLAVGLPLTRFGAEKNDFIKYLTKNKRVSFKYENEPYYIEIDDVAVFPQCYAAVVDKIPTMAKKTLIVDIGSWTIDIMPVIIHRRYDVIRNNRIISNGRIQIGIFIGHICSRRVILQMGAEIAENLIRGLAGDGLTVVSIFCVRIGHDQRNILIDQIIQNRRAEIQLTLNRIS